LFRGAGRSPPAIQLESPRNPRIFFSLTAF
jgi:hypothetical protein